MIDATEQFSVTEGFPRTTPEAVHRPASAGTVTAEGQVTIGACVSITVTI